MEGNDIHVSIKYNWSNSSKMISWCRIKQPDHQLFALSFDSEFKLPNSSHSPLSSSDSSFHILPISERIWVAFISKYHNRTTSSTRIRLLHTRSLLGAKAHIAAKRSLGLTLFRGSLLRLTFGGLGTDYPHSLTQYSLFSIGTHCCKRKNRLKINMKRVVDKCLAGECGIDMIGNRLQ